MGNRHGGEKPAKEDKEDKKKKKKEKKAKKKSKKKTAAGSDVDLDPESSHFSRADSESMVFHSAENLSPYLDASTRSEEGAACADFPDNGHILSSRDFHDGFSIEACLPADLAATGLMSDITGDATKVGDDVNSMASGSYSTPLLSSPDVRRGIPRSPLAQRQKDSFLEPVPPIPSDFSSNTLSSVSYQEDVSSSGTERSSSRASSSTVDTNPAHCIERLEELERNIERTIIEKFAHYDSDHPQQQDDGAKSSDDSISPLLRRRRDLETGERSREGSATPRGIGPGGVFSQSVENSPAPVRKISEPCRPFQREGSATPKGIIHGMWSQSAENSPVIVRKALPSPESPMILRRTPSQSPTVQRKFPANASENPVLLRRGADPAGSPKLSPNIQRRAPAGNPDCSPRFAQRMPEVSESSGVMAKPQKSTVPPPVPPKPSKTLTSPEIARRIQNMPKSPVMARKVYAFQEQQAKDSRPLFSDREDLLDRSRHNQMPPRSPSRSPEVRHRVARKTPSSSPSPKSLGRKLMPLEDRAPPPAPIAASSPTQIRFCEQQKGIPVKHCIVATQPSTAVVLAAVASQESLQSVNGADVSKRQEAGSVKSADRKEDKDTQPKDSQTQKSQSKEETANEAVSEDAIKQSTESAVFGSVSPKLKRQKKISGTDGSQRKESSEIQRTDSLDSSPRSPPCSPQLRRDGPTAPQSSVSVIKYKGSDTSVVCVSSTDKQTDLSPGTRRAQYVKQNSSSKDEGTLSADIAGGLTYHTYPPSDVIDNVHDHGGVRSDPQIPPGQPAVSPPLYAKIHKEQAGLRKTTTPTLDRKIIEGTTVHDDGATTGGTHVSHKIVRLAPAKQAIILANSDSAEISHGVFTADNTVAKNATGKPGNAGRESSSGTAGFDDERVRACGRENERGPAPVSSVTASPPFLPEAADSSTSSVIGKSLGQRIREVINESTFREVFTAELSSSSFEKDDGTYTSDDSVFAHSSIGRDWADSQQNPHGNFRRQAEVYPVDIHLSDSSCSSPQAKRAKPAPKACVRKRTDHKTIPPPPAFQNDGGRQGTEFFVQQGTVNFSPDTTTIRRIDVDVNVTLPHSQQAGETVKHNSAAAATVNYPPCGSKCLQCAAGQEPAMMDASVDSAAGCSHSSSPPQQGDTGSESVEGSGIDKHTEAAVPGSNIRPTTPQVKPEASPQRTMETTHEQQAEHVSAKEEKNATEREKGDNQNGVIHSKSTPPSACPTDVPPPQTVSGDINTETGEKLADGEGEGTADSVLKTEGKTCSDFAPIVGSVHQTGGSEVTNTQSTAAAQKNGNLSELGEVTARNNTSQGESVKSNDTSLNGANTTSAAPKTTDTEQTESAALENVPPPSPSAMDILAEEEEEEEEEEDVEGLINAHKDSDISSRISEEMKLFGETVVRRLSSLLESQASESDSCVEESRTDLLQKQDKAKDVHKTGDSSGLVTAGEQQAPEEKLSVHIESERHDDVSVRSDVAAGGVQNIAREVGVGQETVSSRPAARGQEIEPVLHEELNTFSTSDLPGERLVTSDTTETLSTDHETSASSKRESTTSTATDETLTSFKTRSTTDSAEFDDTFVLPESLVFVRSVDEGGNSAPGAMVETGRVVKRPSIPSELTKSSAISESVSHKPRKKRRRQVGSYDVSHRTDVTEPVPKRGSKQIRDVIDAYCDEISDDSDLSSSTDDIIREGVYQKSTFTRSEHQPAAPSASGVQGRGRDVVRKPKPPADRSTDSSDADSADLACKRLSSSSQESSLRIPEIEETFGELMGVKTLLEDLEDKTPTTEPLPVFLDPGEFKTKEPWSAGHFRRSRTSPAKTDRTESDLDVSEQRDDASTDSMYADDEDDGTELVFQRSYSEEHGGEVVLSCTIYNSTHDNDGDSDEFWADAEATAADENYKTLETSADAAGSAFQNARIQMHDIHQHLQDLRRQMELLQDDITSTSLTLTPEYSLESEHRPLTE